jgi:hypothetical protein
MIETITHLMDWLFSPVTFLFSLVRNYRDIVAIADEFVFTGSC